MESIEQIVEKMTLEEKAALCIGAGPWTTTPVERLGIPRLVVSDGPHGVRRQVDLRTMTAESHPATCFPTAGSLACTWDLELAGEMGQAMAEEAIALGVDVLLGPGVNMKRSPLGGRNFEYYSEDPHLAGEMAASLINGLQSRGVGASLKHFAANNQEYQRFSMDVQVDERSLREIYLSAFETAVKKAQPWTVMCAYNKLNGTYCAENDKLLNKILRDEWGFEGFVVSDWGAVHERVRSLASGLELEMPGPQDRRLQAIIAAVRSGTLDEAVLDQAVQRILRIVFKAQQTPKGGSFDSQAHHALARKIATDGMVLLKNNGILPLKGARQIAVIGRAAQEPHFQGGGSSHITPTLVAVPFEELQAQAGDADLTYAEGYPADDSFQQELIDQAVDLARAADVALLFIAPPASKESEGYDRTDLDLTRQQIALIQAIASVQPRSVVILNNSSAVAMSAWMDGVAAILEAWMMGQAGGAAIVDVLFGRAIPGGKLAETFPARLEDLPARLNWPGENGVVRYGEGLFIGYRYYDASQIAPLFPFGYGLSYTTFAYSNPKASAAAFMDVDGVIVSVDVTNTGSLAGKEIIQVYVHDQKSGLRRPPKELKGFAKVTLQPGETKTVSIPLGFRAFAFYHPAYKHWITEDGAFDLLIGASAADIRCRLSVELQSSLHLPCILDEESTLQEWLDDPRGKVVIEPLAQQIIAQMSKNMGGESGQNAVGMDLLGFMLDMPLGSILHFQENGLPMSADEIVEFLLGEAHKQA